MLALENSLSTRSFIARPTVGTGYSGIHVQLDGVPSHHLPLLLAAYQYKFGRNVEAMAQHLIDDIAVGWDELGTDLLDDAPTHARGRADRRRTLAQPNPRSPDHSGGLAPGAHDGHWHNRRRPGHAVGLYPASAGHRSDQHGSHRHGPPRRLGHRPQHPLQ